MKLPDYHTALSDGKDKNLYAPTNSQFSAIRSANLECRSLRLVIQTRSTTTEHRLLYDVPDICS